jgi:hypothetical protein
VKQIRRRLTYANVMSSIAIFVVLGGAAVAATQLPKNSVGSKQLKKKAVTAAKIKKNAVTAAKIKKDAVTAAKIKAGAVDGSKIADGSVTGADINAGSVPYARVVHQARSSSPVGIPDGAGSLTVLPLSNATYTQEAGRNDTYLGAVDVTFDPSCAAPRSLIAVVAIDSPNPNALTTSDLVSVAQLSGVSTPTVRANMSPYISGGGRFIPPAATPHTISVSTQVDCAGAGGFATATFAGVDVVGVK